MSWDMRPDETQMARSELAVSLCKILPAQRGERGSEQPLAPGDSLAGPGHGRALLDVSHTRGGLSETGGEREAQECILLALCCLWPQRVRFPAVPCASRGHHAHAHWTVPPAAIHVHARPAQSQRHLQRAFAGLRCISLDIPPSGLSEMGPGSQKPGWGGVVLGWAPWLWWHQEGLRDSVRNHTHPGQADGGSRGIDPKEE